MFTPSELALLISGVPEIDVDDWQMNTRVSHDTSLCSIVQLLVQYCSVKESGNIVLWFWKLVRSLKEEEKALLLKFATGSPCVPLGGFASLQVLIMMC